MDNNNTNNKPTILAWCDYAINTGFGNVSEELFSDLHKDFNLAVLGVNYRGHTRYDTTKAFVYSTSNEDPMGLNRLPKVLTTEKPELIFLFQDIFHLPQAMEHCAQYAPGVPIITYFPIDGNYYANTWESVLEKSQAVLTYTEYAKQIICDYYPQYKDKIKILPHGVNTDIFYELPDGSKDALLDQFGWKDKFVVGSINRYQPRKSVPALLRAYALFLIGYNICDCGNWYLKTKDRCDLNGCDKSHVIKSVDGHEDSLMYLHMNNAEQTMGPGFECSLQSQALAAGFTNEHLNNNLALNGRQLYTNPYTQAELNGFYNSFSIHASTALGEGFGLSLAESAASGTTNIAPNNSAIPEVLGIDNDHHIINNITHTYLAMDNSQARPLVDIRYFVSSLEIEYLKWVNNGRKKVVNNKAINHVLNKFNWEDKRKFLKNILFDIHTK